MDIRDGYVVVANFPYVATEKQVIRRLMTIALTTSGERTGDPPDTRLVVWLLSLSHRRHAD